MPKGLYKSVVSDSFEFCAFISKMQAENTMLFVGFPEFCHSLFSVKDILKVNESFSFHEQCLLLFKSFEAAF